MSEQLLIVALAPIVTTHADVFQDLFEKGMLRALLRHSSKFSVLLIFTRGWRKPA
jgi:hypothetical protein